MEVKEALTAYGIPWDGESLRRLEIYRAHLKKRNAEMDLTSVPDEDTAERHFADSLTPLRYPGMIPDTGRAADVGSGAGFPGLALAVFRPGTEFFLIEAQEKRCAFLRECAALMGLGNVKVLHMRAEEAGRDGKLRESFSLTAARALAPTNVLCEYLAPLTAVGGKCVLWKGAPDERERRDGDFAARLVGFGNRRDAVLRVGEAERTLVTYEKLFPTPDRYPRRSGIPSKRPLSAE